MAGGFGIAPSGDIGPISPRERRGATSDQGCVLRWSVVVMGTNGGCETPDGQNEKEDESCKNLLIFQVFATSLAHQSPSKFGQLLASKVNF